MDLEKIMLLIVSGLLVWAAVADWRTRQIPRAASFSLLLVAVGWLMVQGRWWEAVFVGVVVIRPAKKLWMYIPAVLGLLLVLRKGFELETVCLVVGVLTVQFLFDHKILGGGDAQIATATIAVLPEWRLFIMFVLVYVVVVMVISIRRFGVKGWIQRWKYLSGRFRYPIEEDTEKIQTPWVVIFAGCTLLYIWVSPWALANLFGKIVEAV